MDTNSIRICVRCRPWHPEKELPFVSQHVDQPFFQTDGFSSPRRPISQGSIREVVEVMDHRQLDFDKPPQTTASRRGQPGAKRYKDKRYVFDHVFGMKASQQEVFEHTVKPLLPGVLDGLNATVFAYGATGCGKTHTISGDEQNPGIIFLTIEDLFRLKAQFPLDEFIIEVSMVEIYNEEIRDLLSDAYPVGPLGGLKMLEKDGQMKIGLVTTKRLETIENVMELVMLGNTRRSTSFTHSNSQSSRSHAVLQISITRISNKHDVDHEGGTVEKESTFATLSIIDLAGSERAAATHNQGTRMKEGAKINQSLLSLSSCIHALCLAAKSGTKAHIPYRNSKLTRMLKFSLGGNCRTVMIVCVSPSSKDIEDTHNTLTWANRAKEVKTTVSRNTAGQPVTAKQYLITIDRLNQTVALLQAQIAKLQNPGPGHAQPSTFSRAKAEAAAKEAKEVLEASRSQVSNALHAITTGARQRAVWDNAEMQIQAYQREIQLVKRNDAGRSEEEIAKAVEVLQALIHRQRSTYIQNAEVSSAVQQEANLTADLDRMFTAKEQRSFGDDIDKNELATFRATIMIQRGELEKAISAARETGYRESASIQADALARAISLIQRYSTSVEGEVDLISGLAQTVGGAEDLSSVASRLTGYHTDIQAQLVALFNSKSAIHLPPPPPLPQPQAPTSFAQLVSMSPARRGPAVAPISLGPPSRSTPTKPSGGFKVLPAAKRLLNNAASSPRRNTKASSGSPLRPALRKFVVGATKASGRTPKKTARWRDEAGAGNLDDRATAPAAIEFSSPSDISGVEQEEGEWQEEDSNPEIPKPTPIALPKRMSMIPRASPPNKTSCVFGSTATVPSAASTAMPPPGRVAASTVSAPITTASSPSAAAAAAIPEWKKNRLLLGKSAGSRLSPLGEERESSSSPDRSIGLGQPSRPGRSALGERHDNPIATTSALPASSSNASIASGSASFFANLARPTASSLAKAEAAVGGKLGAPSRRMSSIGPQRNRRLSNGPYGAQMRRSRGSMVPGQMSVTGDASMANMTMDSLPAPSRVGASFSMAPPASSLGPPARALPSVSSSATSPGSNTNRRSSFIPPPSSGLPAMAPASSRLSTIGGPRASISIAPLSRVGGSGLSSRQSISNLRPLPSSQLGMAGAGDSSMIKQWR